MISRSRWLATAALVALAGCAVPERPRAPDTPVLTATEGRALVARKLPAKLAERSGWAADIYAAISALQIAPSEENICAIVAVTEQESGFKVDPEVPNLSAIAWKEIERQRESAGIPKLVLHAALAIDSSDGRSYSARLDKVKTEQELSAIYDDLIGRVPLAKRFLADRNPVRTGGPMQVGIAYAASHREQRSYPYPMKGTVRDEVFTRRGGMYFGIAHLLDYPASYDGPLHRFADFNAGHYASRNAAFQKAVADLSGINLDLDGDLLRYENGHAAKAASSTELATRVLAPRLEMSDSQVRSDLERGTAHEFERSRLYTRVFALADQAAGKRVPRATVPRIALHSAKFTRPLTTEWFANRVSQRYRTCMQR